jgi:putative FmdB family regulatory protein
MPTYEYQCEVCGFRFEQFQRINEDPVKICPRCKGKVKRLISGGGGLLFKGNGFYITDYRSESYKKQEKEEKASSSEIKNKDVVPKAKQKEENSKQ